MVHEEEKKRKSRLRGGDGIAAGRGDAAVSTKRKKRKEGGKVSR